MGRTLAALVCLTPFALLARAAPPDGGVRGDDEITLAAIDGGAREGVYHGVAPGASNLPPHPPKLPLRRGPQRMTWPGFQVKDGVPTVFLEVTGPPSYTLKAERGALIITLKDTVVPIRNNRRELKVKEFKTAVQDIETRATGRTVTVTIRTRVGAVPAHAEHVEPAAGGFQLLVIELK
jgi:hypothetical protein